VLVILLLGWVAILVIARIQVVVIPAVLALLLATFLHPPVRALAAAGVPRGPAALGVVVAGVGLLAAGVWAVYVQVRDEAGSLADDIEAGVDDIEEWLIEGPLGVDPDRIDRAIDQGRTALQGSVSGEGAIGGAMAALEVLAGAALTVVLLFFFLKDGARMWEWLARRAGADARPRVLEAGARAWWALGGYMRGQAIIAAADAFFIGIGILVLGVPFAVPSSRSPSSRDSSRSSGRPWPARRRCWWPWPTVASSRP
jgi:predicted PurR-regulated permease PerM